MNVVCGCESTSQTVDSGVDGNVLDASSGDVWIDDNASSVVDDADPSSAARDFTLRCRAMDAFVGHPLNAWVVETTGGHVVGFVRTSALEGPECELRLPNLVPEGDYRADVWVDANGNDAYDGVAIDRSWTIVIPTLGSATAMLSGTTSTVDLASVTRTERSAFSATLNGFLTDETSHRFELRVIDTSNMATVGALVRPQLGSSDVMFSLPGILDEGGNYNVDFWVDSDGNGVYSGPPSDHTWRVNIDGTSLQFMRTDTYTELDWR